MDTKPPSNEGKNEFRRIAAATKYSCNGLRAAFRHEAAFRTEALLFVAMAPLGVWLGKSGIERALLVGSLLLVLIVEIVNSAIETVVDRIGPERHVLSGRAKDIGSAAVFLALINVIVLWLLVLL